VSQYNDSHFDIIISGIQHKEPINPNINTLWISMTRIEKDTHSDQVEFLPWSPSKALPQRSSFLPS